MVVVDLPRRFGAIDTAVTLFVDDLAAKEVAGVIADVRERAPALGVMLSVDMTRLLLLLPLDD
jgi:hypothetical protein